MAIDLAKKVWKEIHKQIKKYNPSKYHAHFFYQDVTELIDTIVEVKWVPDLIIFQYVFSDMEKHCESEKLRSFISKIAQFINVDMCVNGQGAELWETVFAVCGKAGSFSIGP